MTANFAIGHLVDVKKETYKSSTQAHTPTTWLTGMQTQKRIVTALATIHDLVNTTYAVPSAAILFVFQASLLALV